MFEYSEKFLQKLIKDTLDLDKSKVIMWQWDYPYLKDVRNVFKQTEEEDQKLIDYYEPYINQKMTTMQKAVVIAKEVNKRMIYDSDINIYGKLEYWATPYETHKNQKDDCDGYSNLIVQVSRLFGVQPYEIFTRAGDVVIDEKIFGHAHPIVFNKENRQFYVLEGSFYPEKALLFFGKVAIQDYESYNGDTWFITNDLLSFSNYPIIRFVR